LLARRGVAYLHRRNWDKAIADETRAITLDPQNTTAYYARAIAHRHRRDYAAALADLATALRITPDNDDYFVESAIVRTYAGDYDGAVADYERALAVNPGSAVAFEDRCWTRATLNRDLSLAADDCSKSLNTRPKAVYAMGTLALVQFREGKLEDALTSINALLERHPKIASSLYLRGIVKNRLGRDGAEDIAAARAVDPDVVSDFAAFGVTP